MGYGLEVYNSENEKVFSSENKTLQMLDYGQFSLNEAEAKTISFTPTNNPPTIWTEHSGLVRLKPNNSIGQTYVIKPTIGKLSRNSSGEYVSFEVRSDVIYVLNRLTNAGVAFPWTINYIVFV